MSSEPAAYQPGSFPPPDLDWAALIPSIASAHRAVGQFDALLRSIPNPNLLLPAMQAREAVLSSRIEGTQTSLSELLLYEADPYEGDEREARFADMQEVVNYRRALDFATDQLNHLPLCNRLIRGAHEVLMQGVRGRDKEPGQFRRSQNWIGPPGSEIEQASYIPCPIEHLDEALTRWELFLHQDFEDPIVQLALIHAEFEAIHPFLDGNGRVGRMTLPLFLYSKGLIGGPYLFLSEYLESNRNEYYRRLLAVSQAGDWDGWCLFFVRAVAEQADHDQSRAQATLDLYDELKNAMPEMTKSPYGVRALDWIFTHPHFLLSGFIKHADIPQASARRIVRAFCDEGLLSEVRPGRGRRSGLFAFSRLLNLSDQN